MGHAVLLQGNSHQGYITPMAWVAGMIQWSPKTSYTSKLPEEHKKLLNRSFDDLSKDELEEFRWFFYDSEDAFVIQCHRLGRTFLVQLQIKKGNMIKTSQPSCRCALAKQEETTVQDMLTEGIIKSSSNTWSSPVALVAKKDRVLYSCADYWKPNNMTKKDCYPLPCCILYISNNCFLHCT